MEYILSKIKYFQQQVDQTEERITELEDWLFANTQKRKNKGEYGKLTETLWQY